MRNANKSHKIPKQKWKSDQESASRNGSSPKVN